MNSRLDPVHIDSIEIVHAPGLPNGLILDSFGPGVNVIFGPNASGKSTTARLLHQLFSHSLPKDDIEATIRFSYQGVQWRVWRRGGHATAFRNDQPASLPRFASMDDETGNRYLLSLHDLLRANDTVFAQAVLQEAAGGYDLELAIRATQLDLPKTESSLTRDLDLARRSVIDAQRRQELLRIDETQLDARRDQELAGIAAHAQLGRLTNIQSALDARFELELAEARLKELSPALALYRGDEERLLADIAQQRQTLLDRQRTLLALRDQEQLALDAIGIVPGHTTREIVQRLQAVLAQFERHDSEFERAENVLAIAVERERGLRAGISTALDVEHPTESARVLLNELGVRVNEAAVIDAQRTALLNLQTWIGEIPDPVDVSEHVEAIRLLRLWLRVPGWQSPDPAIHRLRWIVAIAAAIIVAEAILLGIALNPVLFALAALGLVAGAAAVLIRPEPQPDDRSRVEAEIARLGIAIPDVWDEPNVTALLNELSTIEITERYDRLRAGRWSDLSRIEADLQATFERNELERFERAKSLGLHHELSAYGLSHLADSIRDWLQAVESCALARAELASISRNRDTSRQAFNQLGSRLGLAEVLDPQHAAALLDLVRQRETDANRARLAIEKADYELETVISPGLHQADANESALFERVGAPDRETLLLLAPGQTAWHERKMARDAAITTFNDRMRLLDQVDLDDWSAERVHAERLQQERIAAQLQSVSQQIGAIVKGVADARAGNDIDQALRSETAAKEALRERFGSRARQIVARRIADHVRRESELSSLSPVALIARQRFAAFTRGRYLLHFRSATGTPRFVAEDRDNGNREVELDHLSSATRLQLLIAVRAAFVEHQEKEALLPVFLDETLANSDDTRADAMVAASNDLSSHGRQLFYFTAQEDEVERWESWHQANPSVHFRAIPLGSGTRESPLRPAVTLSLVRKSVPPVPLDCTRFDYRELLGGLPVDLWSDSPGDIHLWYVIPDLDRLRRLLDQQIETWGHLQTFVETGMLAPFGIDTAEIEAIRARAMVCHSLRIQHRVGRARPVSPLDLDASGAISDRFRQDGHDLLQRCARNGNEFLQQIKIGAIKGFQSSKTQAIEDYLSSNGFLATEARLENDELRRRVIIDARMSLESEAIGLHDIDRLFDDLSENRAAEPLAMQAIGE